MPKICTNLVSRKLNSTNQATSIILCLHISAEKRYTLRTRAHRVTLMKCRQKLEKVAKGKSQSIRT